MREIFFDATGMSQLNSFPPGFADGMGNRLSPDFGSAKPPPVYLALADAIMRNAPTDYRPIDVAYYFNALREGRIDPNLLDKLTQIASKAGESTLAQPSFLSLFAYDWEKNNYSNPVVVGFLRGIGSAPYAGDETPWCAAFANWCISQSRTKDPNAIAFGGSLLGAGTRPQCLIRLVPLLG